jgi:hypothetical protein
VKRFGLSLLVLITTAALAAGTTANLSWTVPAAYTSGAAMPASDIASYVISWAPSTGQSGPSGALTVAAPATSATVPVACGSTTFTVAVTTTATATYPNATSSPSNAVPYATGVTCQPVPPVLTVQ